MDPKENARFAAMNTITAILNTNQHKLPPVKIGTVFNTANQFMKSEKFTPEMKAGAYLLATGIAMAVVGETDDGLSRVLMTIIESTE